MGAKRKEEESEVQAGLGMLGVEVVMEGIKPGLMMHNIKAMTAKIPEQMQKKGIKSLKHWYETDAKAAAAWQAESGSYRLRGKGDEGPFCIPTDNLRECWKAGCAGFKVGKMGGKKENPAVNLLVQAFAFSQEEIPLQDPKSGKYLTEFSEVVTKIVRIPPGPRGARVPASWGLILAWQAKFILESRVPVTEANINALHPCLEHAGRFVGLMEGRPEKKRYQYGCFRIVQWKVIEVKNPMFSVDAAD